MNLLDSIIVSFKFSKPKYLLAFTVYKCIYLQLVSFFSLMLHQSMLRCIFYHLYRGSCFLRNIDDAANELSSSHSFRPQKYYSSNHIYTLGASTSPSLSDYITVSNQISFAWESSILSIPLSQGNIGWTLCCTCNSKRFESHLKFQKLTIYASLRRHNILKTHSRSRVTQV